MFKNIFNALRISYEGAPTIIGVFLLSFLVAFTAPSYVWISMGLLAFVIFTFRNPDRNDINLEDAIYSPADGRVVDIKEGEWNISGSSKYTRIGIYLSLFNVHVQRIPYSGEIIGISYNKGKKYPAFRKKASMYNESNMVILNTKKGILATKQIAGMITRRIICKLKIKQFKQTGSQLGVIIFGSRVELFIPCQEEVKVKIGDKVKAGITLISK